MPGDTPCPVCNIEFEKQRVAAMARLDALMRGVSAHLAADVIRDAADLYEAVAAAASGGQTIWMKDKEGNVRELQLPHTLLQSAGRRPTRTR